MSDSLLNLTPTQAPVDIPNGVWPVMLTPFHEDRSIDWAALDELIEFYLRSGVAGLFAVCQSSEMFELLPDERLMLAERVVKKVEGRVPVVASGTFGDSSDELATNTRHMSETGVTAVVCLTAALAKEGDDSSAWRRQAAKLLAATGKIPLGLYECPRPYHRLLEPESLHWAATTGRFLFLKETSCRLGSIEAKIDSVRDTSVKYFNANAETLLASLELGGHGFSGISLNFVPELWNWLCRNWRTRHETATRLQSFLASAEDVFAGHYPESAKHFLALRGLRLTPVCRTPAETLTPDAQTQLKMLEKKAQEWRAELSLSQDID